MSHGRDRRRIGLRGEVREPVEGGVEGGGVESGRGRRGEMEGERPRE